MNLLIALVGVPALLWVVCRLVDWLPAYYAREEAAWLAEVRQSPEHPCVTGAAVEADVSFDAPDRRALWHEFFSAMPPFNGLTAIAITGVVILAGLLGLAALPPVVTGLWFIFGCALIVLALVDAQTKLLPDALTLPMIWLGLVIQLSPGTASVGLELAVIGAVAGYLPLWLLAQGYRLLRGRDGLGMGDLKLLAAMGAWSGPWIVPQVIFLAALIAIIVFLFIRIRVGKGGIHEEYPFGPWIVLAYLLSVLPPILL